MDQTLLALLSPVQRLALAYAPARARGAWLAVLALDARLGQQVRSRREPMLMQIRLAWWRDRLGEDAGAWPSGEPLLAALADWHGQQRSLVGLVDGWETLLGEAPLAVTALEGFVAGRAAAMAGLARVLGYPDAADTAYRAGAGWAIADLVTHLSHPEERAEARLLAGQHDWNLPRLPHALRPLVVLQGLGARSLKDVGSKRGNGGFLLALRLGIIGR